MNSLKLKIEILSPLHIGSGRDIEPFDYLISHGKFYRISLLRLLDALPSGARNKFEALIDQGRLTELRQFIAGQPGAINTAVYVTAVSKSVSDKYSRNLDKIENQLLVHPFIRTRNEKTPFIPGSSIKGAIRTAVLNYFSQKSERTPRSGKNRDMRWFEGLLLKCRDAKTDPFRALKFRDVELSNEIMCVSNIRNMGFNGDGRLTEKGMEMTYEVTGSNISGNALSYDTEIGVGKHLLDQKVFRLTIDKGLIKKACKEFYVPKMKWEHNKFFNKSEIEKASSQLLQTDFGQDSFPIRIGRFSQFECVTLDKHRQSRTGKYGNTRNVAEKLYPMGWAKCTFE